MRGPFHRAGMGVSNNERLPQRGAPRRSLRCGLRGLLAGVHVLDAVALVLEGRAVGTLEVLPAALLAVVFRRFLAGLLAEVDIAYGPTPGVIGDDERGRADVPGGVRRDERCPGRVAADRAAVVEDRARGVVHRVDETRAVVAVERADIRVEVGRPIAGHVDRQADPRAAVRRVA